MVVDVRDEAEIDRLFHALADRTRRDIVRQVLAGEQSVSGLARRYPISTTAVQKHVRVLADAGLVTARRHGRELRIAGEVSSLQEAQLLLDRLEQVWRDRFARIDGLLAEERSVSPTRTRMGD